MRKSHIRKWMNQGYNPHTKCDLSYSDAKVSAAHLRTRGMNARAVKGQGRTYCVMTKKK